MALFKKYDKVQRWDHTDEVLGIEKGLVHIQEKVDGANGQVFFHDGHIVVGKRSCVIGRMKKGGEPEIGDKFRGLPEFIFGNDCYWNFFSHTKDLRLYGEWLVKHTVNYDPKFLEVFYVFDVYDDKFHRFMEYADYAPLLERYGVPSIPERAVLKDPNFNDLVDMVKGNDIMPSTFGAECIEGLVFKNYSFVNKWGNNVYMKAVTKDFREVHHLTMGATRHDDVELQLVAKYLQPARMEKIYQKMIDTVPHVLSMKDVPRFMGMVYYDMITEDAFEMFCRDKITRRTKGVVSFQELKRQSDAKAKNWYVGKLERRTEDAEVQG